MNKIDKDCHYVFRSLKAIHPLKIPPRNLFPKEVKMTDKAVVEAVQ